MLINGDFQVWQRGTSFDNSITTTSYVIYTADRWWTNNEGLTFTVSKGGTGGIVLSAYQGLYQTLETPLEVGETYTLSTKINDEIIKFSFTGGTPSMTDHLEHFKWGAYDCVQIRGKATERTIYWVKLEKSSIATPFVPRLYAEELALCQRYYQVIGPLMIAKQSEGYLCGFSIHPMRTTPTYEAIVIPPNGNENITVTGISFATGCVNYVVASGTVLHTAYQIRAKFDAEFY